MVIKTSDCSRTISLLVLYWNLMTMGLESWASNATGNKKKSCLDHAVALSQISKIIINCVLNCDAKR